MEKELVCKWCHREFKRRTPKNKHQLRQICRPVNERTYCEICDITCKDRIDYERHMMCNDHLKRVMLGSVGDIKIKKAMKEENMLYHVDPYMELLEKNNESCHEQLGDQITLFYKDNTLERLDMTKERKIEREKKEQDRIQDYIDHKIEQNKVLDYKKIVREELLNKPRPTIRQGRILDALVSLMDIEEEKRKEHFKNILRCLTMEDADFLMAYIRDDDRIDLLYKQWYCNIINQFIHELVKVYNKGIEKLKNGMDILEFVSKLSK